MKQIAELHRNLKEARNIIIDTMVQLEEKRKKQDTNVKNRVKKIIRDWIGARDGDCDTKSLIAKIDKYFEYKYEMEALSLLSNIDNVKKWYDEYHWNYYIAPHAAYFRKVNFLYRYFENRLLYDGTCIVTKDDIKNILKRAKNVLAKKDASTSARLLPTRSGFFFGGTNYDDWYYLDVDGVVRSFTKILDEWEDGDAMYVYMSW